jgi:hypothetical protein
MKAELTVYDCPPVVTIVMSPVDESWLMLAMMLSSPPPPPIDAPPASFMAATIELAAAVCVAPPGKFTVTVSPALATLAMHRTSAEDQSVILSIIFPM